jgi:hypothetical protein
MTSANWMYSCWFSMKKIILILYVMFPVLSSVCLRSEVRFLFSELSFFGLCCLFLFSRVLQPPPAIFFHDFPSTGSPVQASLLFYFSFPPFSCWGLIPV